MNRLTNAVGKQDHGQTPPGAGTLRKDASGVSQIVFFVIAAAAPLTAVVGVIPTALIIERCPLPFGDRSDARGIGDESVPG